MTKIKSSFFNNIIREDDSKVDDVTNDALGKEDQDADVSDDNIQDPLDDPNSEINKMEYSDDEDLTQDKDEEGSEEDEVKDIDEDTDFFTTIINDGAEKGYFYYDPEKEYEGTGEEILDQVQKDTLNKRWEDEYINQIPEEYQSILDHLKLGKPLDEWVEAIKPTDYDSINLEDEDNQKMLIEDHLTLTGMDEEDIKDAIKDYEDSGILDKKSKIALKYLKKNDEKKVELYEAQLAAEIKDRERQDAQDLKDLENEILTKEDLQGFKLDKSTRQRLFEHITKPVNKRTGESQLVINQKSRDKQLLVAYLDMIDFKFEDIAKKVETKVASSLRAKLSTNTDINAKRGGTSNRVDKDSKKIPRGSWDTTRELDE